MTVTKASDAPLSYNGMWTQKNKNDKDEFIKKGLVHKRLILIVKGRNNMRNATVGVTSGCTT